MVTSAAATHRQIYQILKDEYDKVLSLFDEAIKNGSRDTFMQIKDELDAYLNGGEELLYPALKGGNRTHDITMEGYQEHHVAKILLSELDTMSEKDEMWTSKLKVLQENVRHHVEEEEKEMFPASKQVLSDQAVRVSLSDLQIVTIKMRSHGLSKELDLPFP